MKHSPAKALLLACIILLLTAGISSSLGIGAIDISRPDGKGGKSDETIRLRLPPGGAKKDVFYVTNLSDKPLRLYVYPADGAAARNGGVALAGRQAPRKALAKWVTMAAYSLTLAPKETRAVGYQIAVPATATADERIGGIVAEKAQAVKGKTKGNIRIKVLPRAAILLIQRPPGRLIEKMRLLRFGKTWESNKIRFNFLLKNLSNVHQDPAAKIDISSYFTQRKVDTLDISNLGTVFPQRTAALSALWKDTPLIGLYKASAKITYGQAKQKILTDSITIIIFPWWIILIIVAAILIFIWSAREHGREEPVQKVIVPKPPGFPPATGR